MGGYFNNDYDNNDYDANAPRNAITAAPAERSSLRPGPCFLRNASICSVKIARMPTLLPTRFEGLDTTKTFCSRQAPLLRLEEVEVTKPGEDTM